MAVSEERELAELKDAVSQLHKDFESRVSWCESYAENESQALVNRYQHALKASMWLSAKFVVEKLMARHSIESQVDQ